jgi:hypothetical protein
MWPHKPDFYESIAKSSAREYGSLQENNNSQTRFLEYLIDYYETRTGARKCEIQRSYSVIMCIINTGKNIPYPTLDALIEPSGNSHARKR